MNTEKSQSIPYQDDAENVINTPRHGKSWTIPDFGMELMPVNAGSFEMGSDSNEAYDDERPVHTVYITEPFWMGRYEVTNGAYKRFLDSSRYDGSQDADDAYLKHFKATDTVQNALAEDADNTYLKHVKDGYEMPTGREYPICWVSWKNANMFCEWLNDREKVRLPPGYEYRLPTEAEWEYAARGGHKSRRDCKYAGSDNIESVAWHIENSEGKTHPVGKLNPNELGLHDMSGNVWEWCLDWYDGNYYEKTKGAKDPFGCIKSLSHVLRGGFWNNNAKLCRSTNRCFAPPSDASPCSGFRVVLAPSLPKPRERIENREEESVFFHLGACYEYGEGVKQNLDTAVAYYEKAAKGGHHIAQLHLGHCYYYGKGVSQDFKEALRWYEIAAKNGNAYAMYNAGDCYEKGIGAQKNKESARKWHRIAWRKGIDIVGSALNSWFFTENDKRTDLLFFYQKDGGCDLNKYAFQWLQKLAKNGDPDAQCALGIIYYEPYKVSSFVDLPEECGPRTAFKWLHKAALQGHAQAQYALGYLYWTEEDIEEKDNEGEIWLTESANQGNQSAQDTLGFNYTCKREPDFKKGIYWLERLTANEGFDIDLQSRAKRILGDLYFKGLGVERDIQKAIKLYQEAIIGSDSDEPYTEYKLGLCYEEKDDLNIKKAIDCYRNSADKDDPYGQYRYCKKFYENGEAMRGGCSTASYPQSALGSDELVRAHSRRLLPMDNSSFV